MKMQYQKDIGSKASQILKEHKIVLIAAWMRTGKTNMSFNVVEESGFKKALFITTKAAMSSIKDDYQSTGRKFNLEVINYESAHKIKERNFDVAIIDECHSLGAFPKKSKRVDILKTILKDKPIIFLSGTPTPESWSQLFHIFYVSSFSPFSMYSNFYRWANDFVMKKQIMIRGTLMNDYSNGIVAKIKAKVDHLFVSCTQEEAGFKHTTKDQILSIPMPANIEYLYKTLEKDQVAYYLDKAVSIAQPSDLIQKLSQLCGGTLIFDECDIGTILSKAKSDFIKQHFSGKKIAIYYKYRAEFEILSSEFKWTSCPEEFKATGPDVVFLGQLVSKREGVDLSCADALIVYNLDYSATTYFQVRERMQKYNREKEVVNYYLMFENSIETDIWKAITKKKNFTWAYYRKSIRKPTVTRPQSPSISLFDAAKLI